MTERIFIFGASGHGKVVADAARLQGFVVTAFFDDNPVLWQGNFFELPVVGGHELLLAWCRENNVKAGVVAIGNNITRHSLAQELLKIGLQMATVVHPTAVVAASVRIGQGSVVMAGAVVNPDTVVGDHCIINTGAVVDHDCHLGEGVHIAPGCQLCGGVTVGEESLIGAGTTVIPGIRIGAQAVVGAGSTVIHEVPPRGKVAGCPARPLP